MGADVFAFLLALLVRSAADESLGLCGLLDPKVEERFYGLCHLTQSLAWDRNVNVLCSTDFEIEVNCSEIEASITVWSESSPSPLQFLMSCTSPNDKYFSKQLYIESSTFILPTNYTKCVFSACYETTSGISFVNKTSCISPSTVTEQIFQPASDFSRGEPFTETSQSTFNLSKATPESPSMAYISSYVATISISGASVCIISILTAALMVTLYRIWSQRKKHLRHLSVKRGIPFSQNFISSHVMICPAEFTCTLQKSLSDESLCHSLYDRNLKLYDDVQHLHYVPTNNISEDKAYCKEQPICNFTEDDMKYFNHDKFKLSKDAEDLKTFNQHELNVQADDVHYDSLSLESDTFPEFNDSTVVTSEYMDTDERLRQDNKMGLNFYPSDSSINRSYSGFVNDLGGGLDYVPAIITDDALPAGKNTGYVSCAQNVFFTKDQLFCGDVNNGHLGDQVSIGCASQFSLNNSMSYEGIADTGLQVDKDCYDSFNFFTPIEDEQERNSGYLFHHR